MSNSRYVISVNGDGGLIFGAPFPHSKSQPGILSMRRKDAEKMAEEWPVNGQIVVYKLVPVKNFWHEPKV